MELSSMVHGIVMDGHRQSNDYRPQQTTPPYIHTRVHSSYQPGAWKSYSQPVNHVYLKGPQSPPSPPVEDSSNKPSLPSISSLLGIADGERPSTASRPSISAPRFSTRSSPEAGQHTPNHSTHLPQQHVAHMFKPAPTQHEMRKDLVSVATSSQQHMDLKMRLPPTPPMQPEHVADGNNSPSAASTHSSLSAQSYYLSSLNNMDPEQQRRNDHGAQTIKKPSPSSGSSVSPYTQGQSPYQTSPQVSSPGANSTASYYSPESSFAPANSMYSQRPLPADFPPQPPYNTSPTSPEASNLWQHHHYISANSASAFPQSQDRYICSTCNKAFSRPSSLRIHSHSHTGEKPYKCPQPGCGKAFSVRSNMKRHERGCHAAASAISVS